MNAMAGAHVLNFYRAGSVGSGAQKGLRGDHRLRVRSGQRRRHAPLGRLTKCVPSTRGCLLLCPLVGDTVTAKGTGPGGHRAQQ